MATVVTKTVKPGGGGDYTTLQAAHDAEVADLVTADVQLDLVCYAGGNLGQVVFDFVGGWTTDATRYVRIVAASADRHTGVFSTSKAYIDHNSSDGAIAVPPAYTRIEGIQMRIGGDDNNMGGVISALATPGIRVVGCLIIANPSSTTYWSGSTCKAIYFGTDIDGDCFAINNLLIGWNVKTGNIGIQSIQHDVGATYCYNNTLIDCDVGIVDGYSKIHAKNNLVQGATTPFSGSFNGASDYNATNGTGAPGTNSRNSQTFTFEDAGADDYRLAAGDGGAKGFGLDLTGDSAYPVTDDILGYARATPFDIGAFEYDPGYVPPVLPFTKILFSN